jgi:hypothetical protein
MHNSEIQSNLLSGEHVLWSGEPGKGIVFTGRDVFMIPFSLMWCAFAIFWTFAATGDGAPIFFTLWGMMFVLIGVFFVFGRFVADMMLRRNMIYALTDRRVLISRSGLAAKFTALRLDALPDVKLTSKPDGTGSISFGNSLSMWGANNFGIWIPSLDPTPQFIGINDARNVYGMIQRAADQLRTQQRQA